MMSLVRLFLAFVIIYCLHLQAKAEVNSAVSRDLIKYSNTKELAERISLAVNIIKSLRAEGGLEKLASYSQSEQKVIQNANDLLIWVMGEARKFELSLSLAERSRLSEGVDDSLMPAGLAAIPVVNRQCQGKDLKGLGSDLMPTANYPQILQNLASLIEIDRFLNRTHYYQQLAQFARARSEFTYRAAIIAYLDAFVRSRYPENESRDHLVKNQELVKKRNEIEKSLTQLGVQNSKQAVASLLQSAPHCF